MSLPDFQEKQILFVRGNKELKTILRFVNENLVFSKKDKKVNQVSCHNLFAVFVIGECSLTSVLIRKCRYYGISLFFLKENLQIYASINSPLEGNYLLRQKQYRGLKDLEISKQIVKNKIYNQFVLLKNKSIDSDVDYKSTTDKIDSTKDYKEVLGIEGNMSKRFFKEYFGDFGWMRRLPRTKYDIPNLLLDIGYSFLFNFIDSLLNLYGFDVYRGYYHKLFFQRKSLSCDLVEPFRCIIDRALFKAYRLKQVDKKDFIINNKGYRLEYRAQNKYARIFFQAIMRNKKEIFNYIQGFYHCIMDDSLLLPFFKLK